MSRQHPVRRYRPRRCRADARRTPLESARWLETRYRAIVATEEAKGPGADAARVDAALKAIAGLVRAAAPYRHPRIKPVGPTYLDDLGRGLWRLGKPRKSAVPPPIRAASASE
jgi:hypothetical protein